MAISEMSRLSILAPEELLDDVLTLMQGTQSIEIIDINDSQAWDQIDKDTQILIESYTEDRYLTSEDIIDDLDTRVQRIEKAIKKVEKYVPSPSFFKRMREGKRRVSYQMIEQHGLQFDEEQIVNQALGNIRRLSQLDDKIESLKEKYDDLYPWRELEITPNQLKKLKFITGVIGRVPTTLEDDIINHLKEDDSLRYHTVYVDEHDYGIIVLSESKDQKVILNELKQYQFIPFNYYEDQLPQEQLVLYREQIESTKAERQTLIKELKSYSQILEDLKLQYEYVNNLTTREKAKYMFTRTKHLIAINGWIETQHVAKFKHLVQTQLGNEIILKTAVADIEKDHDIPTKLDNRSLFSPFEMITEMYGIPNYDEVDPTPLIMPFYSLFFGMMLGDLGYGLLLLLGGLIPLLFFKLEPNQKKTFRLVLTLAISGSIWGYIYGSFFGYTIPAIQIIDLQASVMQVMLLSMAIGIVHMGIGFGINVYLKFKDKQFALAYAEGLHWLIVILGIILIAIAMAVPGMERVQQVGIWLIVLSFIGMFIAYVVDAGSISGLGAGLLGLINGVSYFGDVISYSRLMALGLSGVSIGAAFNLIIEQFPPTARFTIGVIIFLGLHLFNLFLSVLTGGVHSLRLIFVEFFGKFYTGQGRAFKPLEVEEKYITIKQVTKMEDK